MSHERKDASAIILYDEHKKVLLQYRGPEAPRLPNQWGLFSGGLDEGETPEQAVHREAKEELGITLKEPRYIHTEEIEESPGVLPGTLHMYIHEWNNKEELRLLEGEDWGRYTIEDAEKLKMIPHDKRVLKILKEKI